MDYIQQISEKREERSKLQAQAEQLVKDGKLDEVRPITDKMNKLNDGIKILEGLMDASRDGAEPVNDSILHDGKEVETKGDKDFKPFASLGEQLKAVHAAATGHGTDKRLIQVNNAVLGANEGVGSDGGFALQTDFASAIMESAVSGSDLLNRLDRYVCSANSNSMRYLSVDETDVSKSVFGGVMMHWAAEGGTVPASKPQFRELKLDLEKMMGFGYVTDEMLQDAPFMTGFMGNAFTQAAQRLLIDSVINGDGNGKPLGILHSGALVEVAKESGQAADTFVGMNAVKMQARAMPRGRDRLVWLMHPDLEEQLPTLAIQSGDAAKFLWNPEGGLGGFDTQRVLGKPVLFEDSCAALGDKGDVILVDPLQYLLLTKGTAKQDWSMHVEFLTDQQCFRIVYRCNGAPKVTTPLTINHSTKTRSPFVTLAKRA